jgi:arylsulfatase A-like enzyme
MEPHLPYYPPRRFLDKLLEARGRSKAARASAYRFLNVAPAERLGTLTRFSSDDLAAIAALQDVYDAEVRAVDAAIEELLSELEERGLLNDAIVVVTADHGEEFNDHVRVGHGAFLFEEAVRIPLLISARGRIAPRRLDGVVSHVDIAPTILGLLGIDGMPALEGRDVTDRLTEPPLQVWLSDRWKAVRAWWIGEPPPAVLITEPLKGSWGRTLFHDQALVVGTEKVILDQAGAFRGYDLAADPGETEPAALGQARRDELHARLLGMRDDLEARATLDRRTRPLSEEQRDGLRALGYLVDEN